jgi:hypothetical protein
VRCEIRRTCTQCECLTGRGVSAHAPLPVRHVVHMQCVSYREGCLYLNICTPLPVRYAVHRQQHYTVYLTGRSAVSMCAGSQLLAGHTEWATKLHGWLPRVSTYPFSTGCLPLSDSGNPGVSGISYRGGDCPLIPLQHWLFTPESQWQYRGQCVSLTGRGAETSAHTGAVRGVSWELCYSSFRCSLRTYINTPLIAAAYPWITVATQGSIQG